MCSVLRCNQPASKYLDYVNDPLAPRFETPVCEEHMRLIEAGAPWRWNDDDMCLLMGDDLDSGGHLVLGDWTFSEWSGQSELKIECTTPSGKGHEPLRFVVTADELQDFLASFRNRFPDAFNRDDHDTE